ncbi:seven in absentia protein [Opisthorchis viverrini]|uniref:E3 ubiquitin-protein ligase n=1 Tax=Opisthorchis viverrini TaxID=6198 RepID=A0A1S8X8T5_OPIVI|nr:seven in absentia protein [Opisthorchis viverrini]
MFDYYHGQYIMVHTVRLKERGSSPPVRCILWSFHGFLTGSPIFPRFSPDNIRNLAMEKLASSVLFPCKFSTSGCPETFHYTSKAEHESVCEFRCVPLPVRLSLSRCLMQMVGRTGASHAAFNAPSQKHHNVTSCELPLALSTYDLHFLDIPTLSELSVLFSAGEDIVFLATDINLPGAVDWVMMQSCFGHSFMLVLEKQERVPDQIFFALVQLIGTRKQAEQFVYRLELNGHRRRLTWEACPRSIHDGVQSAISSSDCLVFDLNTAQLFADNGNLGINVTISQVPSRI